jgi:hypothetical protein
MGKVGTEKIFHKGSGKSIFCTINFYAKSKLFTVVDFPENIEQWYGNKVTRENEYSNAIHNGKISADSYDKCVELANKVYTEFYDQEIREEKIICYQIKMNHPRPEFHGLSDRKDIAFCAGLAISIDYKIMYRIYIGQEAFISKYNYEQSKAAEGSVSKSNAALISENSNGGLYDWHKIIYTTEAHEFFEMVQNSLLNMIQKVDSFFGDSPGALLEKIESGKFLSQLSN